MSTSITNDIEPHPVDLLLSIRPQHDVFNDITEIVRFTQFYFFPFFPVLGRGQEAAASVTGKISSSIPIKAGTVSVYYVCCLLKAILNLDIFYYPQISLSNELRLLFPGRSQYCLLGLFQAAQTIQLPQFLFLPFFPSSSIHLFFLTSSLHLAIPLPLPLSVSLCLSGSDQHVQCMFRHAVVLTCAVISLITSLIHFPCLVMCNQS